jgi:8-hydroxy-5-deazaflavin:NADPH oxidoreductase
MVNPTFKGGTPTGQVEAARAIEPLCMLWCIPGFLRNEWMSAFKLLTA